MGRKKYFCDYCLRAFNDDPKSRSAHLTCGNHLQLKEEHYRQFKDAATILEEEQSKKPCFHFKQDGHCRFGYNCKYSHFSPEEIDRLKRNVEKRQIDTLPVIPNASEWLKGGLETTARPKILSYVVPFPTDALPPSLVPFDIAEFLETEIPEWGD